MARSGTGLSLALLHGLSSLVVLLLHSGQIAEGRVSCSGLMLRRLPSLFVVFGSRCTRVIVEWTGGSLFGIAKLFQGCPLFFG